MLAVSVSAGRTAGAQKSERWMQSFPVDVTELVSEGENPYFILKPGYELTLAGKEGGKPLELVVTVLNDTMNVGGVTTRVVEERERIGGQLVEVSRNYFAIHPKTKDVYYFGEDVDIYKDGKIVNHEGAWHHGEHDAHFGLMMPGVPALGLRHYQELAPKVAMDRVEIVSLTERVTTPAGVFDGCLKMKETTPLERFARDYKIYAPGIGIVQDGAARLVSHKYIQNAAR
jgi:hypothetical protein